MLSQEPLLARSRGAFTAGPGKRYVGVLHTTQIQRLIYAQFPIGMGTGAVYVTLSGLKQHSSALTVVETGFYFLNITLFLLNTITLLLQAIGTSITSQFQ